VSRTHRGRRHRLRTVNMRLGGSYGLPGPRFGHCPYCGGVLDAETVDVGFGGGDMGQQVSPAECARCGAQQIQDVRDDTTPLERRTGFWTGPLHDLITRGDSRQRRSRRFRKARRRFWNPPRRVFLNRSAPI
jgi:hypothetical protein